MTRAEPLVYFHGLPGSPLEIALAGCNEETVFAPDISLGDEEAAILAHIGDTRARLIGFSLGAFRALRFAARHPDKVAAVHLIAPAAPLCLGNFLPHMAGGPIFRLARYAPRAFRLIAFLQSAIARHQPAFLARRIFATAQGGDRALVNQPEFRGNWIAMIQASLGADAAPYCREILAYASAPADFLASVQAPVTLYYGTLDNWTPPAMATALAAALPRVEGCHAFDGASHYSTLSAALLRILDGAP